LWRPLSEEEGGTAEAGGHYSNAVVSTAFPAMFRALCRNPSPGAKREKLSPRDSKSPGVVKFYDRKPPNAT
jgi:hypothetical protein